MRGGKPDRMVASGQYLCRSCAVFWKEAELVVHETHGPCGSETSNASEHPLSPKALTVRPVIADTSLAGISLLLTERALTLTSASAETTGTPGQHSCYPQATRPLHAATLRCRSALPRASTPACPLSRHRPLRRRSALPPRITPPAHWLPLSCTRARASAVAPARLLAAFQLHRAQAA